MVAQLKTSGLILPKDYTFLAPSSIFFPALKLWLLLNAVN